MNKPDDHVAGDEQGCDREVFAYNSRPTARKWCSEKDSNLHLPVRNRLSYPLERSELNTDPHYGIWRKCVTHGGLEPPTSRSQTERVAITLMSDMTRRRLVGSSKDLPSGYCR